MTLALSLFSSGSPLACTASRSACISRARPGFLRRSTRWAHRSGGSAAMAAYGLGTLPWLMGAGLAFGWLQKKLVRALAGTAVLAFGVYGLAHGADLRSLLCL